MGRWAFITLQGKRVDVKLPMILCASDLGTKEAVTATASDSDSDSDRGGAGFH